MVMVMQSGSDDDDESDDADEEEEETEQQRAVRQLPLGERMKLHQESAPAEKFRKRKGAIVPLCVFGYVSAE